MLLLVVGKGVIYVIDQGVVMYWYGYDIVVYIGYFCVVYDVFLIGFWCEKINVVGDGVGKQMIVL